MARKRLTRQEAQAVTRSRLLDAAEKVCARKGILAASLDDIADEAGFSRGAIYSNFKNKDDLLVGLFEDRIRSYASELLSSLAGSGSGEVAQRAGQFVGKAATRDRRHFVLLAEFWSYAARDPAIRKRFVSMRREYRRMLTDLVRQMANDVGAAVESPERIATGLLALSAGLALEHLVDAEVEVDVVFDAMVDLVYRGAQQNL